jgi:Kef-type K+ transport system membrane component KefB
MTRPAATSGDLQTDALTDVLRRVSPEDILLPILVQLAVIVLAARLFGRIARAVRQPAVVGEIVAGLVLGPSVLGRLWPGAAAAIFHPAIGDLPPALSDLVVTRTVAVLSQLGLIFLLFLVGMEFDFGHLRWHGRTALSISAAGLLLPFGLGVAIAPGLLPHAGVHPRTGVAPPELGFTLFLGVALSITAIPILGRIMMDLGITRTRLAAITITAAAVDDAAGWILLAAVAAIVQSRFSFAETLARIALTAAFALAMALVVRPVLCRWLARRSREPGDVTATELSVLLAVVLAAAAVTSRIGVFAVLGAFAAGAILSDQHAVRAGLARQLGDLVSTFFLPIFFTYTGLHTDVGRLDRPGLWWLCLLVLVAAVAGKLGGCFAAARLGGLSTRDSACVGVMMNTRALMALVVINLGDELGVIPPPVYTMLVLMAIGTTLVTTPLLLALMRGTELEPHIRRSGFLGPDPDVGDSPAAG